MSAVNNVDTREKMADLEAKIVDLEKQNVGLKNKVQFISSFHNNNQIHHNMYFILSFKHVFFYIQYNFFVISVKSTSIKFELTVIYDYFQWLFFKLTVAKQQLQTQGKRATHYDHVKPRVQTVSGDQHHMYFSQIKFFWLISSIWLRIY